MSFFFLNVPLFFASRFSLVFDFELRVAFHFFMSFFSLVDFYFLICSLDVCPFFSMQFSILLVSVYFFRSNFVRFFCAFFFDLEFDVFADSRHKK